VVPDARLAKRLAEVRFPGNVQPEIVVGSLRHIPEVPLFDTILYIDVLEHIRSDVEEMSEAARHLAPGAHLVVLSPAFQGLYSKFDEALGHERRYAKRSLARVFPSHLERVALFYLDSLGMLLSLGNRLMLRQATPSVKQILFWDRRVIPVSRILDRLVGRSFGRSIIAVYRRPGGSAKP
jgi:hypothetical protein